MPCVYVCSGLQLSARDPERSLRMVAVLDPLSPDTQHLAPVLQTLHAALSLELSVYFNPVEKLSELPVKTYVHLCLEVSISKHRRIALSFANVLIVRYFQVHRLYESGLESSIY